MSRVSILMPVYNAAEYLDQAISSVREQTFTDWELLILNDGSTDWRVREVIDRHGLVDRRIRVTHFEPTDADRRATVRYATLVNWGAEHTTGEYLVFLPGDDYLLPDALGRMVAKLTGRHDMGVVYGAQRLVWEGTLKGLRRHADDRLTDAWHRVDMSQVMVTRHAFKHVGGWQDTPASGLLWRCADGFFWRRLTGAGFVFVPVPGGPVSVKRYRADSVDERVKAGLTPW